MKRTAAIRNESYVHLRAFGAERSGLVLSVGRRESLVRWMVDGQPREKWVSNDSIYRELKPDEPRFRLPTREGPFYCHELAHKHAEGWQRDACARGEPPEGLL